jgi:hypothetical protein
MISAYEHGRNAARLGKHIQACPFDYGTAEWQEWRDGFLLSAGQSAIARGVPRTVERFRSETSNTTPSFQRDVGDGEALIANDPHARSGISRSC